MVILPLQRITLLKLMKSEFIRNASLPWALVWRSASRSKFFFRRSFGSLKHLAIDWKLRSCSWTGNFKRKSRTTLFSHKRGEWHGRSLWSCQLLNKIRFFYSIFCVLLCLQINLMRYSAFLWIHHGDLTMFCPGWKLLRSTMTWLKVWNRKRDH